MPDSPDLRLGIDVGGTNTDAVVLNPDGSILGKAKRPTTDDLSDGIAAAVRLVLDDADVAPHQITRAMLGTTHATNAILQRRNLDRVAVVRIGSPATHGIPIAYGWPADLREAVVCASTIVRGGFEYDGREIVPFEPDQVRRFLESLDERPDAVAVTGVFSAIRPEQEQAAADIATEVLGDVEVSLSHEIGGIGLIERENATILNASLHSAAREALTGFVSALTRSGITAQALFAQNDGTLMSVDQSLRLPVLTIGSGPSNSIRGAAHLADMTAGLVVDIGGTTTDIGALVSGFPRESYGGRMIGGVATNFRMPDVVTIPLGGGTVIRRIDNRVVLGPDSVGKDIRRRALIFGGDVPTLTDAAVLAGRMDLGDPALAAPHADLLREALALSDEALAAALEQTKTSRVVEDVVVVGGGRPLFPPDGVVGTAQVPSPADCEVANAAGAGSAAIGAEAEAVIALDSRREEAIRAVRDEAADRAVAAGADPEAIEVLDIVEVPLAYLSPPAARLRVRVSAAVAVS